MPKTKLTIQYDEFGESGNAFVILGRAKKLLADGGYSEGKIKEFMDDAQSSDYEHLKQVVDDWFTVE